MLSRTAEGLFWLSRYIERAENIARLLDAGRRLQALPSSAVDRSSEWGSIVIASGCSTTYKPPIEEADQETVIAHLVFDPDNPSSIYSCLHNARENARAMRTALTAEVWNAANDAWIEMRSKRPEDIEGGKLAGFLEWVKLQGFTFRGAIQSSQLRNSGYDFLEVGQYIERADATARLLDVKYHVLLPDVADVGRGLDHMQWVSLLRAVNSRRAFRWVYRSEVTPDRVVHFLILSEHSPRSITYSYNKIVGHLDNLRRGFGQRHVSHKMAHDRLSILMDASVEEIFGYGLHEWLTDIIVETNHLAGRIAVDYGFGWRAYEPAAEGQIQA